MCVTVMLAVRQTLVRKGIRALLEQEEEILVEEEAESGSQCLEKLRQRRDRGKLPCVLLSDLFPPGTDGIRMLKEIRDCLPEVKVLLLSGCGEISCVWEAVKAGVHGYLLKSADPAQLKTAVRVIFDGEKYIQPELEERMKEEFCHSKELLTEREQEILIQTAEGKLNKEIADILHITERTVKNHLSSIFRKIHVSDRTQAAVYAVRNHIVELEDGMEEIYSAEGTLDGRE